MLNKYQQLIFENLEDLIEVEVVCDVFSGGIIVEEFLALNMIRCFGGDGG